MRSLSRVIFFAIALELGTLPAFVPTATNATIIALNTPQLFDSESAAQWHCPRDVVQPGLSWVRDGDSRCSRS